MTTTMSTNASYTLDQSAPVLKPDMLVLDVGCGPGSITIDIASRVPHGRVVGVEKATEPLESARKLAQRTGAANIVFEEGDALALPFPDGNFDLVHAHQVLKHVQDPVGVLREMRRVARPGGLVAVREFDFDSAAWYPDVPGLQESCIVCPRVARMKGVEPNAGRRLVSWALQAGFARDSITATAGAWCYSTAEERAGWSELLSHILLTAPLGTLGVEQRFTTQEDLERMAQAWKEWSANEDGWYSVLNGEIVCRV